MNGAPLMKLDVLPTSTQANPRCKKWGVFKVTYAMYEVSSHGELTCRLATDGACTIPKLSMEFG